jgi:hypothetical protein
MTGESAVFPQPDNARELLKGVVPEEVPEIAVVVS